MIDTFRFVTLSARPGASDTIKIYDAGTTTLVTGLTLTDRTTALANPFTPSAAGGVDDWGFVPPGQGPYDVWWEEGGGYLVQGWVSSSQFLQTPPAGYGPNIVKGDPQNAIATDVGSATISGGGQGGFNNVIGGSDYTNINTSTPNPTALGTGAHYSVITGGYDNIAGGQASVISGFHNYTKTSSTHGTIGGGSNIHIDNGDYNTVAGGTLSVVVSGSACTISGGREHSITATGGNATIGGGFQNTSNGDSSTVGGGSTNAANALVSTISGGIRNTTNGQRSTIGGGDTNLTGASGTYSVVGGGFSNTANAYGSVVSGGEANTTNGNYSTAGGYQGIARLHGERAYSAGQFAATGDATDSRLIARRITTDATPSALYLNGTDKVLAIPTTTTWTFRAMITARCQSTTQSAGYVLQGVIRKEATAGTTTLVGSVSKTVVAEDVAAWDVNATADTTNGALTLTVTGEAGKSIKWLAAVEVVQVTG